MTEHEQLEKITDIVRDYTDSRKQLKKLMRLFLANTNRRINNEYPKFY